MSHTYQRKCGSYYIEDEHGYVLYMCDQIAMLYDPELGVLHKHGSPEDVLKHFKRYREVFPDIEMITIDKRVPLEEINRCITNSGYIKTFVEKMQTKQ